MNLGTDLVVAFMDLFYHCFAPSYPSFDTAYVCEIVFLYRSFAAFEFDIFALVDCLVKGKERNVSASC